MSKPTPGKQYTIVSGDTLSKIASRAYGDATLWRRIWAANQTRLKSGDPDLIFPGEVINIPVLPERQKTKTPIKRDKDKITIVLDGLEVKSTATRVIRTLDTAADGFSASIPWTLGKDKEIDKRLIPYGFTPAEVYIGNDLAVTGLVYSVEPVKGSGGTVVNIEGASLTADIVDSTLPPPYERNNVTLNQLAKDIVSPLGIGVVFEASGGGAFDRVTAGEGETIFAHLAKLAKQRSLVISSTPKGELLFTQANISAMPVAFIEEDEQGATEFQAKFDGRQRFNAYRAIGRSPIGNKDAVAKDNKVPRSRFVTFNADETTTGDISQAAKWRRSKSLADALTLTFPMVGWYNQSGNLWRENTIVTVKSPSLRLENGFTFIVKQVEYIEDDSGRKANLSLVPPQVYTGGDIIDPWK